MSTSSVQQTAQIIQFPVAGRRGLTERRPFAPVVDLEQQAAAIAVSDAWYHDAAIQDSKCIGER